MRRAPIWGATGIYAGGGKRLFDLCCVIATIPVWMPLIFGLWLISWLEAGQGGYVDHRVGRGGRLFSCLKIRTMVHSVLRPCAAYKTHNDPRITKIGHFLRRSSLDELPQLICVLKGEMSLVGPRPVPASELKRYEMERGRYLSVRPGLTGLWQVSGRNALSYRTRIALDVRYSEAPTFAEDLRILCATCREIWRMSGR
jgi:lipopolysaccharide/colanic/teichoic acid biosynthesis glycosyltransferase